MVLRAMGNRRIRKSSGGMPIIQNNASQSSIAGGQDGTRRKNRCHRREVHETIEEESISSVGEKQTFQ